MMIATTEAGDLLPRFSYSKPDLARTGDIMTIVMRASRAKLVLTIIAAAVTPLSAHGQSTMEFDGRWTVDLSTDPTKPYEKQMQLKLGSDGSLSGSFYDSRILAGRWKNDRGRTCVSFETTDGAGPYHTSACLRDGNVEGQTWAEHRSFLFNWNAKRAR